MEFDSSRSAESKTESSTSCVESGIRFIMNCADGQPVHRISRFAHVPHPNPTPFALTPIEWSDDELDENEYPDEVEADFDESDGDTVDTLPCPDCGAEVYAEAQQCTVCGNYVTFDSNPWQGKSTLWIVLGLLGILAVVWALSFAAW